MTAADWGVIAAGAAAIAWVNWYFFLARRPAEKIPGGERTEG
jgi:hypothetical protein